MTESDLELYSIVGRMFREIRESKGLPLEAGASYLNIAPKSLQRYECGERKIKIGTIKELCDFYKISCDAFIMEAKLRFGKNINEPTYYSCPECGFSYLTDSAPDIEEHSQIHQAWINASSKFGKLYCYSPENESIKAKNRNIRNDLTRSIDERYNSEINILRCLFSRSVESSGFDLNHVPFNQYIAMMLNTEKYRNRLDKELLNKLTADYGTIDGIKNGESIYYVPNSPKIPNENVTYCQEKIMEYYETLNDIGKHEATKRVEELTHFEKYTTPEHLLLNAAHERTDIEITEEMLQHDEDIMDDENF